MNGKKKNQTDAGWPEQTIALTHGKSGGYDVTLTLTNGPHVYHTRSVNIAYGIVFGLSEAYKIMGVVLRIIKEIETEFPEELR